MRFYLSKDDMITLIKSTISNLPNVFPLSFPILASVAKKIHRYFIWSDIGDEFNFHLVK